MIKDPQRELMKALYKHNNMTKVIDMRTIKWHLPKKEPTKRFINYKNLHDYQYGRSGVASHYSYFPKFYPII